MITFVSWIIQHADIIGWATLCTALGGLMTARFVRERLSFQIVNNEDLLAWLGALGGLAAALVTYQAGLLASTIQLLIAALIVMAVLAVYWLLLLPRLANLPSIDNPLLNRTLRRYSFGSSFSQFLSHLILLTWSLIVIVPIWTMVVNSLKAKREIYRTPFEWPTSETLTFEGYRNAWVDGSFDLYFRNSLLVTVTSLVLILLLGSLAAYGLANWRSRLSSLLYLYFVAGLMVPIRLGTINIVTIVQDIGDAIDSLFPMLPFHFTGSYVSLMPIYIAMGLPITAFVLTAFMRGIPQDLTDAARIDGASEFRIFWQVILPLVRPALATVTVFNMIPIWNDLWFPLILTRDEPQRTVTYGVSLLFGQYQTDWNAILSTLSLASVPVLILYLLMSKQFIKGLTAGAVKG